MSDYPRADHAALIGSLDTPCDRRGERDRYQLLLDINNAQSPSWFRKCATRDLGLAPENHSTRLRAITLYDPETSQLGAQL